MIWIDRLAIVVAVAIAAILVIAGEPRAPTFGPVLLRILFWLVVAPWAFIRGLIWAFCGRAS